MKQPPDFLWHWGQELLGSEFSYRALSGGINNLVYKISNGAAAFVIKGYPERKKASVDRMKAEISFLEYAQKVAPLYVPSVIQIDLVRRCVVMEYIDGHTYDPQSGVSELDVQHMANFISKLNHDPEAAGRYISHSAADGFLSISEHISNIQARIDEFQTNHLPTVAREICDYLLIELRRNWESKRAEVEAQLANGDFADRIPEEMRIVSPSDYGFHNAIRNKTGTPTFIDFEFAGLDDPSKALADIFLQPRITVSTSCIKYFRQFFDQRLDTQEKKQRFCSMFSLLKIKWRTIILSFLNPNRLLELPKNSADQSLEKIITDRVKAAADYKKREHAIGIH
jgi:Phosphotransferase enzyme family